jgi:regulatory protein
VVRSLREEGLVDDAGYARRFAEDRRLIDQWGTDRIARDLARRGIGLELIEGALAGIDTDDEMATAIQLLDRRFPMPFEGEPRARQSLANARRRGYQPELAYSAVRRHEQGLREAA